MSDAIFLLRLEHDSISRVLEVLDDQIERLAGGAPVDDPLLEAAVAYLRGFPDECHHPKEDLLYRKLAARDTEAAGRLSNLVSDHQKLSEVTERFDRELREVVESGAAGRSSAGSLHEFVRSYRRHMEAEERAFFPAALAALTRDDLAELDHELFDRVDPLFDRVAEERFAKLHREVEARSGDGGAPGEEFALLRGLNGVDAFNRVMAGRGVRLVKHRAGGFTLERTPERAQEQAARWLLDIPDCDATRAAWCAYYFMKGQSTSSA